MEPTKPETYFAPPERASVEEIAAQYKALCENPAIQLLLDSFPEPTMLLNRHRQLVQANNKLTELL